VKEFVNARFSCLIGVLLLSTMACRPVISVGWQEILIIGILFVLLLAFPLYRFYKKVVEFQSRSELTKSKLKRKE